MKPKYEKPVAMPLGETVKGSGQCNAGSAVGVGGGGGCTPGATGPLITCQPGSNGPFTNCQTGDSPAAFIECESGSLGMNNPYS
jgi:hypothetical protein